MIKTAGLLGSTIYEIKEAWTGWDELQHAKDLAKGPKIFSEQYPHPSPQR